MRPLPALAAPLALAACIVVPPPYAAAPLPEGSAVALGRSVRVGALLATPLEVVEDSRCPADVRCVWAGRLVVRTRMEGAGWREAADLTLGESRTVRGQPIALVSAEPGKATDRNTRPEDYRFRYEAR